MYASTVHYLKEKTNIIMSEGLGLMPSGGYVRVGFAHYNTLEEIDRVVDVLAEISKNCS